MIPYYADFHPAPTAWTRPPGADKWYGCYLFCPAELRKIVTPGTLIAVPKRVGDAASA